MATDHHHHGTAHFGEADWEAAAAQTELEGEVLSGFVTRAMAEAVAWRGTDAPPVRRVLDVGSGPGVAACELARLFPEAQVVALDGSPAMLTQAAQRAAEHGLGERVITHLAELPAGLDGLDPVDLIWASMSLHHVGDEVGLLRRLNGLLEPHGLLVLAEVAEPMRVLPDDLEVGRPGLAQRLHDAGAEWFATMRDGLPDAVPSSDLVSMVTAAGFEALSSETALDSVDPPLPDLPRRMVLGHLLRTRDRLDERLDNDDLDALGILTDPDDPRAVVHRPDVFVSASRRIVVARPV